MAEDEDTEFSTLADSVPEIPPEMGPGVLSETQRKYIDGFSDVEPGSAHERTVRSRIRERMINGVRDFRWLALKLEDRDIKQAAENPSIHGDTIGPEIGRALELLLRLKYYSEDEGTESTEFIEWMESNLMSAIGQVYVKDGRFVENVEVDISVTLGDEMSESDDLGSLSMVELAQMNNSGELSDRRFMEELMKRDETETLG